MLSKTTNGGQTWSAPKRINDDPAGNGAGQDLLWSSYSLSGKLAIAWRDRRRHGSGTSVPFDIYAAVSNDGGASFGRNERLSSASSALPPLICCNSFLGVALSNDDLAVNWGDYRSGDWDIYFQRNSLSVSVGRENAAILHRFSLAQNYPKPFRSAATSPARSGGNHSTTIRFSLPQREQVTLKVFDVNGREVAALVNGKLDVGEHAVTFNANNLPSGVYFFQLRAGEFSQVRKAVLMK